jgi:hypothetical protein
LRSNSRTVSAAQIELKGGVHVYRRLIFQIRRWVFAPSPLVAKSNDREIEPGEGSVSANPDAERDLLTRLTSLGTLSRKGRG